MNKHWSVTQVAGTFHWKKQWEPEDKGELVLFRNQLSVREKQIRACIDTLYERRMAIENPVVISAKREVCAKAYALCRAGQYAMAEQAIQHFLDEEQAYFSSKK